MIWRQRQPLHVGRVREQPALIRSGIRVEHQRHGRQGRGALQHWPLQHQLDAFLLQHTHKSVVQVAARQSVLHGCQIQAGQRRSCRPVYITGLEEEDVGREDER